MGLLSDADPDDPHAGNAPIESEADLMAALADYL